MTSFMHRPDAKSFFPLDPPSFALPSPYYTLHPNSVNPAYDLVALYLDHGADTSGGKLEEEETKVTRPMFIPGKGWVMPAHMRPKATVPKIKRPKRRVEMGMDDANAGTEQNSSSGQPLENDRQMESSQAASVRAGARGPTLSASSKSLRDHNAWLDEMEHAHDAFQDREMEMRSDAKIEKVKIGLWRVSGQSVWTIDLIGSRVKGLCWDPRGIYLSILMEMPVKNTSQKPLRLIHLSVHDGSIVRVVPLADQEHEGPTLRMSWVKSDEQKWPTHPKGSAGIIIDELVRPDPITPYEPPGQTSNSSNGPPLAGSQTSVQLMHIPGTLSTPPDVLTIPDLDCHLLAGTLRIASPAITTRSPFCPSCQVPSKDILRFAQTCNSIREYLDTAWRGFDVIQSAWKDGIRKESESWWDDLSKCAQDNGTSVAGAHADLTRLLLTGRSGDAVSQFIGSRLTERNLTRWETAVSSSITTIHQVLSRSVIPALERIGLLVEETIGWSRAPELFPRLALHDVEECFEWLRHALIRCIIYDRDIQSEGLRFDEFAKWLRFEHSRATLQDPEEDTPLPALHNPLMVCDYLDTAWSPNAFEEDSGDCYDAPELPTFEEPVPHIDALQTAIEIAKEPVRLREPSVVNEFSTRVEELYKVLYSANSVLTHTLSRSISVGNSPASKQGLQSQIQTVGREIIVTSRSSPAIHMTICGLSEDDRILEVQWYDEDNLAILADRKENAEGLRARYLALIEVIPPIHQALVEVEVDRFRLVDHYQSASTGESCVSSLSTNGRPGRGIAAVLINQGHDLAVFDMTVDEGEEELE